MPLARKSARSSPQIRLMPLRVLGRLPLVDRHPEGPSNHRRIMPRAIGDFRVSARGGAGVTHSETVRPDWACENGGNGTDLRSPGRRTPGPTGAVSMKRREFVEKLGIGSATLAAAGALGSVVSSASGSQHDHSTLDGPLASATVAFGSWVTEPALDRFPNNSPRTANNHKVLPYNTTIKAGGSVTFNISGTHQVLVYAPGTTLESITRTIVEAVPTPGLRRRSPASSTIRSTGSIAASIRARCRRIARKR